jgi:predicted nucleic acid-binding protein
MAGASPGARPADGRRADRVAILLDGSAILAAADRADLNHAAAVAWFARADEPLLLGALTLAELDDLLQRELGVQASLEVVRSLVDGGLRLITPTREDLERAAALLEEAVEHRPRLADALLVAAAERLGIRRIATFDRRPIAVFRPRHVRAFDLEP